MTNFLGFSDILQGIRTISLPLYLARADIRQRYRRSTLGPFWITISTGVMIGTIGLIFGGLFKTPMSEFLPFLTAGLIIWSFISQTIIEATTVFVSAEPIIKQLPIPLFTHVIRMVARNFYIFLHNILIFPIVLLIVQKGVGEELVLSVVGLLLLIVNLLWISLLLGIICARYRDMTQIVVSLLQIFFYVTPIIWMPKLLPERTDVMILDPNPFYHVIQIVRAPLLEECPTLTNWNFSILFALLGWTFTIILFNKYRKRIAYWL
ncbi:ABC transporter permease [Parasutterella muris]|uniref:ABC transporter permease n=1 Tax=Parasutterella muris TaxID=2565572 RepID=A0A6L6YI02_9BURK|nr:ABC transporter permease [Parasutterella muris]MVX56472.1 ABC transporter permease [Parasutterella muris]